MSLQIRQKCIVLRSRTAKPFFSIQHRTIWAKKTDIIIKTLCFSVDPVMKFFLAGVKTYFKVVEVGQVFNCFGLGVVLQGDESIQTNSYIFGNIGTCDYCVLDSDDLKRTNQCFPVPKQLVQMYGPQQFVYLINNGLAAYSGIQFLNPKQSQTVVVSTASGATGLIFCQLLNKRKCKVVGLTSKNKLKEVYKYVDVAVDYKNQNQLNETLKKNSFKYYFDNVGEKILEKVIRNIEDFGKIALCGAISNYNNYQNRGINNYGLIISKRLTLKGLTFFSMIPKIFEAFNQFSDIDLKIVQISMQEFESNLMQILQSGNPIIGKVIVKV